MWLVIGFILAVLGTSWSAYRVWGMGHYGWCKKIGILVGFAFIWLIPIWVRFLTRHDSIFDMITYHFLYFLFICNLLFFMMIVIRDIIWILGHLWRRYKYLPIGIYDWHDIYRVRRTNIFCIILALFLTLIAFYNGMKTPDIREITLASTKIDTPVTIVALTDLHLHHALPVKKIQNIVKRVNDLEPDIIVFVGDTIDDLPSKIQPHLAQLAQLKAPYGKFAVAGNHEFYIGHEETKTEFIKHGITYLFNEGVQPFVPIYIAGVPDYQTVTRFKNAVDLGQAFHMAQKKDYKILLSHRPDFIDKLAPDMIDLQLSGHTHGGQIFPLHPITKLANGYLSGLYETNNGLLYVSRGSGQWGPQFRLFAPSEISVIQLVSPTHQTIHEKQTVIEVPFVSTQQKDDLTQTIRAEQKPSNKSSDVTSTPQTKESSDSSVKEVVSADITPTDPFQIESVQSVKTTQQKQSTSATVQSVKTTTKSESVLPLVVNETTSQKTTPIIQLAKKPILLPLTPSPVTQSNDEASQQAFEDAKQSLNGDIEHILKIKQTISDTTQSDTTTQPVLTQQNTFKPTVVKLKPIPPTVSDKKNTSSETPQQHKNNTKQPTSQNEKYVVHQSVQQPSEQTVVTRQKVITSRIITQTVYPSQRICSDINIYPPEVLRPVFETHSIQDLPPELLDMLSQPAFPSGIKK